MKEKGEGEEKKRGGRGQREVGRKKEKEMGEEGGRTGKGREEEGGGEGERPRN